MSIIIRLQNLPWAANSVDIRRYFAGLSIPEGGVHIVGGEKGDAFIAFSTDEDARQAMEKDGGKIKDIRVKLLLSSRTEMMRVIEQARNQNLALQGPAPAPIIKPVVNDNDRRKVPERNSSPSRRKEREKSPNRDRGSRRSSSKRDRSRSRSRSPPRRSREKERERDVDRRIDRSKRDDRRFDDSQRSKDERVKSSRDAISRDSLQDKKLTMTNGDPSQPLNKIMTPVQSVATNQLNSFDPRTVSQPPSQPSDPRIQDSNRSLVQFDTQSSTSMPISGQTFFGPRDPSLPPSTIAAYNVSSSQPQTSVRSQSFEPKSINEHIRPSLYTSDSNLNIGGRFPSPFDKQSISVSQPSSVPVSYEGKRPSVPVTTAPLTGYDTRPVPSNQSGNPFEHRFGPLNQALFDKLGSIQSTIREPTYEKQSNLISQTAVLTKQYNTGLSPERATGSTSTYDRNNVPSSQGIAAVPSYNQKSLFHTELPLSYEQTSPTVSQTGRTTETSAARPPHSNQTNEPELFGKRLPPNMQSAVQLDTSAFNKPPIPNRTRPSRFQQENMPSKEPPFYRNNDLIDENTPATPFNRPTPASKDSLPHQFNKPLNTSHSVHEDRPLAPDHERRMLSRSEAISSWPRQQHHVNPERNAWDEGHHGLLGPPPPSKSRPFPQDDVPLTPNEDDMANIMKHTYDELHMIPGVTEKNEYRQPKEGPIHENRRPHSDLPYAREQRQENRKGNQDYQGQMVTKLDYKGKREPLITGPRHTGPLLERGSPAMQNQRVPHICVEVRGLPFDACEADVLELFRGIFIPPENLKLLHDTHGQPTGVAFVKFLNQQDFEEGLTRHKQYIGNSCPEVIACPNSAFDDAPIPSGQLKRNMPLSGPPRRRHRPREEDLCIQLRGLPYSCKEDNIVHFFDGLGILDIHVDYGTDGRAIGTGFVEFGTPDDFHAALTMSGKSIGHRYIQIMVASKEMMNAARAQKLLGPVMDDPMFEKLPPRDVHSVPPHPVDNMAPPFRPGHAPFCVALRGLNEIVTNRDIAEFFAEVDVMPRAIHIMLDPNKMPSGEAFAEFTGVRDFERALQKNGKILSDSPISVSPIPYWEMVDILGGPPAGPAAPGPLLENPDNERPPRRPLMQLPSGVVDEMPMQEIMDEELGSGPDSLGPRGPHMEPFISNDMPPFEHMEAPMGGRPPFSRMMGPGGPIRGPRPSRLVGMARPRGPSQFRHRIQGKMSGAPRTDLSPQNFGKPGCVVALKNLHFHAGLEELLEFFQNFSLCKDDIIRKYNDRGRATGEARVAFSSPEEAIRAVEELNQKTVLGRPVALSLV